MILPRWLILIFLVTIGIITPIPYYQNEDVWCESYPPQLCSPLGWHFKPSILSNITNKNGQIVSQKVKTPQSAEEYCSLNPKSKNAMPVVFVTDCGAYKIVDHGCCDIPASILDKNWNKIDTCGGFGGWPQQCLENYPKKETCITISCIK